MPTKKQRRRRAKTFRHEYDFVVEDEEGNEVAVDTSERKAERTERDKQKAAAKPARGQSRSRSMREPPKPSWDRAMRRGGVMGGLMLVAFLFLFKDAPIAIRLAWGLFYAAAFVPLTYFIDRTAYRAYEKRLARSNPKKTTKPA
jgi:hypothetical protein